jgi:hypothetical protein
MSSALAARAHHLAGAAWALVVGTWTADGLWKSQLLHGPLVYFWAYDIMAWVVLPLTALLLIHKASIVSGTDYGLSAQLGFKDIIFSIPLPLLVLFVVYWFTRELSRGLIATWPTDFSYTEALKGLGPFSIVGTVYLSATAALWESIFYIGLPWLFFSRSVGTSAWSRRLFIFLTAVLFGAAHFEGGSASVVAGFFFQWVAARCYFKLGTLWPIIGAHALIDVYYLWPWPGS